MTYLVAIGGVAAALIAIGTVVRYGLLRFRSGVTEVRRWAAIADDLRTTDVGQLPLAIDDLRRQLGEASATTHRQLSEVTLALAQWGAEDQKRHTLVLATAQEALAAARGVQIALDGVDVRLERIEALHDHPDTHPHLIGAPA